MKGLKIIEDIGINRWLVELESCPSEAKPMLFM